MRTFLFQLAMVILFAALFSQVGPWWTVVIAPFLLGMSDTCPWRAALAGFFGLGLLWTGWTTWIYTQKGNLLAQKVAVLFGLADSVYLIPITGLIGALLGLLAGVSGYFLAEVAPRDWSWQPVQSEVAAEKPDLPETVDQE